MTDSDPSKTRPVPRWRRVIATVLLFVGCGLVPLSVLSIWTRNQVLSTDRYVATVGPLADDPAIQQAAAARITAGLMSVADITDRAEGAVPERMQFLVPALEGAVESFVHDQALKIVESEQFAQFWRAANRIAHAQVNALLTGDDKIVEIGDGTVTIDLQPMLIALRQRVIDAGLTVAENLNFDRINTRFEIFQSKDLETAQTAVNALQKVAILLPILAIGFLTASVLLAQNRRRRLMWVGFGVATAGAVLSLGIALARAAYLNGVSSIVINKDAAEAVFDTTVRNILLADRVIIVVGLLISLTAWLTGNSASAVRLRTAATGGATKAARAAGAHAGPVSRFFAAHVVALRITPIVLAVIALAFWDNPRPRTLLFLAILVLLAMVVIEGIARAGREESAEVST